MRPQNRWNEWVFGRGESRSNMGAFARLVLEMVTSASEVAAPTLGKACFLCFWNQTLSDTPQVQVASKTNKLSLQ